MVSETPSLTLILTLPQPGPISSSLHTPSTVIEEKGVKLKLTVTDTPGFGDQINNDKWWVFWSGAEPLLPLSLPLQPLGNISALEQPDCYLRASVYLSI